MRGGLRPIAGPLAPAILFSAAVPFQGGTSHLNERWPEYWAGRFEGEGFVALDPVRRRVWGDDGVDYWYRQNTLLFVKRECLEKRPGLQAERKDIRDAPSLPSSTPGCSRKWQEAIGSFSGNMNILGRSRKKPGGSGPAQENRGTLRFRN